MPVVSGSLAVDELLSEVLIRFDFIGPLLLRLSLLCTGAVGVSTCGQRLWIAHEGFPTVLGEIAWRIVVVRGPNVGVHY